MSTFINSYIQWPRDDYREYGKDRDANMRDICIMCKVPYGIHIDSMGLAICASDGGLERYKFEVEEIDHGYFKFFQMRFGALYEIC